MKEISKNQAMELANNLSTKNEIQETTANKMQNKLLAKLRNACITAVGYVESKGYFSFYWQANKRRVGRCCSKEYYFYPAYYRIVENIYNEYGCMWEVEKYYRY